MNRIRIALPEGCREIMERIRLKGGESYAVGGAVRDALLGRIPGDFDVTTSFEPEEIMALFPDKKQIPTGKNFGTIAIITCGEIYEVTTFRSDGGYTDFRRPDHVTFSKDVREDLARRDFTVNAMAWSEETGLIDPFGGQSDLKSHLLRAVGDPEKRFGEDALRIMRLVRFASELSFQIEPETGKAAKKLAPLLEAISGERLSVELEKLLKGPAALAVMKDYRLVLQAFLGEFDVPDTLTGAYPADLALLFINQPSEALQRALERLKTSRHVREAAVFVHENLKTPLEEGRIALRLLLSRAGEEKARLLLLAKAPERLEELEDILRKGEAFELSSLALNGRDAENELGTHGKETGEALTFLLNAVIREQVQNQREALIRYWKEGK